MPERFTGKEVANSQDPHETNEEGEAVTESSGLVLVGKTLYRVGGGPDAFAKTLKEAWEKILPLIEWPTPVQLTQPQEFIAELYFEPVQAQILPTPKAGQTLEEYNRPIYDSPVTIAENLVRDGFLTNEFDSKEILELATSRFSPTLSLTPDAKRQVAAFWQEQKSKQMDVGMAEREAMRAAAQETRVKRWPERAKQYAQQCVAWAKQAAEEEQTARKNAESGKCTLLVALQATHDREVFDVSVAKAERAVAEAIAAAEKAQKDAEEAQAEADNIRKGVEPLDPAPQNPKPKKKKEAPRVSPEHFTMKYNSGSGAIFITMNGQGLSGYTLDSFFPPKDGSKVERATFRDILDVGKYTDDKTKGATLSRRASRLSARLAKHLSIQTPAFRRERNTILPIFNVEYAGEPFKKYNPSYDGNRTGKWDATPGD